MIYSPLDDTSGLDANCLRLAVLGATRLLGRPITPRVRHLAAEFARMWGEAADFEEIIPILEELRLKPDDILPPDDNDLGRVCDAGKEADAQA